MDSNASQFSVPSQVPMLESNQLSNHDGVADCKVLSMQGGDDHDSYALNSNLQNYSFQTFAKPRLAEAIDFLHLPTDGLIRIADLGCAHGRNTLDYADFIVGKLEERYKSAATPVPEIQYYFSDLPSNDFNSLFRILPPLIKPHQNELIDEDGKITRRAYYAAGVPGSFYRRLFPKGSINFAISAYSLHWISQIPSVVLNPRSPAWNGGHVWIQHGQRPAVAEAFAQQFQQDLRSFLRCRAEELASGAILFFFMVGRPNQHPPEPYIRHSGDPFTLCFEPTWEEMVSEGLIDAEVRDMFNIPLYMPSSAELEGVLKDFKEFDVLKVETQEDVPYISPQEQEKLLGDPQAFAMFIGGMMQTLFRPLVEAHLGAELWAEFWKRLEKRLDRIATEGAHLNYDHLVNDLVLAVVVRK